MTNSTLDRPLVTFAVFGYNQEEYIREAVEGALAQTYEPLEIILSDDCSSDRTFEIMQEMANSYIGPNKVRARQSSINLGTLSHVLEVAKEANGKFIVVAAGDDVSASNRTEDLWSVFSTDQPGAIYSSAMALGSNKEIATRQTFKCIFSDETLQYGLGATAAYNTSLLQTLPKPQQRILHEDVLFASILHFRKLRIRWINKALVHYRVNDTHLEEDAKFRQFYRLSKTERQQRSRRLLYYVNLLDYCKENLNNLCGQGAEGLKPHSRLRIIEAKLARSKSLLNFYKYGLLGVVGGFSHVKKTDIPEILRISLGVNIFAAVRALYLVLKK